jgi:uncharacterized Zn-binding protein involved in type VI secretion
MVQRLYLCVGDPPIHGGEVLPYDGPVNRIGDGGHQVAKIGGKVRCDKCDSIGFIAKSGGSRRIKFNGETALDGDLCICKCSPPPPIKATKTDSHWHCDEPHPNPYAKPIEYDEQIQFMDGNNKPVKDTYYVLYLEDGSEHIGMTNENGHTERIETDRPLKVTGVKFGSSVKLCCERGG